MQIKSVLYSGIVIFLCVSIAYSDTVEKSGEINKKSVEYRARVVQRQKEVQILDTSDNVISKISLAPVSKTITREGYTPNDKNTYKIKRTIRKSAVASENQKYFAIVSERDDRPASTPLGDGVSRGSIIMHDSEGNVLWEKELPEGRIYNKKFISGNGEILAVESSANWPCEDCGDKVYVYDKNGTEILSEIAKKIKAETNIAIWKISKLSPEGKYIALHAENLSKERLKRDSALFVNLENGKYWDSGSVYAVFSISNKGIVKAAKSGSDPVETFNLKELIGE